MFLLGTATIFPQSTTVRGITLSHNKVKKTMTLTIPKAITFTNVNGVDINIEIHKEVMIINGENKSITEPYFKRTGHEDDMGWFFITHRPNTSEEIKEIKDKHIYVFYNIENGEEYILSVSDVCDNKYITKLETGSLIINKSYGN